MHAEAEIREKKKHAIKKQNSKEVDPLIAVQADI